MAMHDGLDWFRLVSCGRNPQFKYLDMGLDAGDPRHKVLEGSLGDKAAIVTPSWQGDSLIARSYFRLRTVQGHDVEDDVRAAP